MYYNILIETNKKDKNSNNQKIHDFAKTDLEAIKKKIIIPYMREDKFRFKGYHLNHNDVVRLVITQSEKPLEEYAKNINDRRSLQSTNILILNYTSSADIFEDETYTKVITDEVFEECEEFIKEQTPAKASINKAKLDKTKVFIVHGHDQATKNEVARFLEKLDLTPIILHEQTDGGKTIIEKIEKYSDVGYSIVLYTPCDEGYKKGNPDDLKNRARQNVVFEHGFLIGKLGRKHVSTLIKGDIEIPNDISGLVYTKIDDSSWKFKVLDELKNAGYDIDANKIF
ncbi:TIR domain-containing protein [Microscilla marina]|uniref:CD-NTase-associated protein 12/Pycsar effector protein TIR domain-containing protein n=1 Tax=Microscilla marina ATCC 23134 TaxID=313606 RepID=A1ZY85_MICM2|nr:nucleotide-binding protein [Microscilla marina]EAY24651.1 conserved hypothetical protein [Microscilla marina ATCC 23134]